MTLEALQKGKEIEANLRRWKNMMTRLRCGEGFFSLQFKATKNKTMDSEYEYFVKDEATLAAFTSFVERNIKECEEAIEKL